MAGRSAPGGMPGVTAGEMLPEIPACRELARARRAGDDSAAAGLAARAGIPRRLPTHLALAARAAGCGRCREGARVHLRAGGRARRHPGALAAEPTAIHLVSDAVDTAGCWGRWPNTRGRRALWRWRVRGIPGVPMLLGARAVEGSGRSYRARHYRVVPSVEEDLLPAVRDALEYELCAGNWGPGLGAACDRLRRYCLAVAPAAGPGCGSPRGEASAPPGTSRARRVRPQVQGVLPGQGPGMRRISAPPPRPGAVRDARHLCTAGIEPDGG